MDNEYWLVDILLKPLSLNDRAHHMAKAKLIAEYRKTVGWLVKAAKVPPCQRIKMVLIYIPPDRRKRDDDNLVAMLKVCKDAVVDAGVVPDDTPDYVETQMPLLDVPSKNPKLQLYIEKII